MDAFAKASRMTDRIIIRDEILRQRAIDMIAELDISKPMEVTVKRYRSRRSLNQNSLYAAWVDQICDETGNDRETVRGELRKMFAPMKEVVWGDEVRSVPRSTAELTTAEMQDYMAKVEAFAATDLGIRLMVPDREMA